MSYCAVLAPSQDTLLIQSGSDAMIWEQRSGSGRILMNVTTRYIYPPRPIKDAVPFDQLEFLVKYGWKFQIKFNGKRLVLHTSSAGIKFYNRHAELHKYMPPSRLIEEINYVVNMLGINEDWSYLDGELWHGKHRLVSDTIILWDIIVANGNWLIDTSYQERYDRLMNTTQGKYELVIGAEKVIIGAKLTDHIFVPLTYEDPQVPWDIVQHANELSGWHNEGEPLLEGVIAKYYSGKLEPGIRENNNTSWQTRSRVRTGRHRH